MSELQEQLQTYVDAAESFLGQQFDWEPAPQKTLLESMRYSLLAGGKRLRPVLTMEFCRVAGGDWQKAIPFGCALEMIHTYSLIHDDLPCMDNDDYRRGRLTNHKVYGEAMAVLAGDALLTAAFETAASADAAPAVIAKNVGILANCAGARGMVGGQVMDIEGENRELDAEYIHQLQRMKTGALLRAACLMGVTTAGGDEQMLQAAATYADGVGLAFQIRDDMLDVIGDAQKLGKATGMDGEKSTFVRLYGMDACETMVQQETARAMEALSVFENPTFLRELAQWLVHRDH